MCYKIYFYTSVYIIYILNNLLRPRALYEYAKYYAKEHSSRVSPRPILLTFDLILVRKRKLKLVNATSSMTCPIRIIKSNKIMQIHIIQNQTSLFLKSHNPDPSFYFDRRKGLYHIQLHTHYNFYLSTYQCSMLHKATMDQLLAVFG